MKWWPFTSSQTSLIFLTVTAVVVIYFGYRIIEDEVPATPCSSNGMPGRCYSVDPQMCEILWAKADTTCRAKVQQLNLPPGRLIGPILLKCQLAIFDQAFPYTRISSPECEDMHKDLKAWKARNPDFR
ncbi:MAG: hypothetical protein AB7K41_16405 [Bdellovibrionales bacterium]